jgi:hypothetical protein
VHLENAVLHRYVDGNGSSIFTSACKCVETLPSEQPGSYSEKKVVLLHAVEVLWVKGGIAPTLS